MFSRGPRLFVPFSRTVLSPNSTRRRGLVDFCRMATTWDRLVRFAPLSDPAKVLLGEPADPDLDVGLALYKGHDVQVNVYSGTSILEAGEKTGETTSIGKLLSPVTQQEAGSIRCVGLNYVSHAKEMDIDLPEVPSLFIKPSTSLIGPWPTPSVLPKITQRDKTGDYESELAIIIGKTCKDVNAADALDYVLGYTAANDVSSRTSQMNQSQWCFSKGFDTSCPVGPVVASTKLVPDASKLTISGSKNGKVLQGPCGLNDMIFNVAQIVEFLSQGTTLPAGTLILTGTPPGVGAKKSPPEWISGGDEFAVKIEPHIGTLITTFENDA